MRRFGLPTVALLAVVALAACGDTGIAGDGASATTEVLMPDDGTTGEDVASAPPTSEGEVEPWRRTALHIDFGEESVAAVECPPEGSEYAAWGTEIYTDDSSICTAAVHAGLVTFEDGGTVEVEKLPGRDGYEGSSANGVSTDSYGAWGGSFRFID